jgi:hypothetical protein
MTARNQTCSSAKPANRDVRQAEAGRKSSSRKRGFRGDMPMQASDSA